MAATPAAYLAFTAPINPDGATKLSLPQIWACLQRKVRHAEEFVGGAILSTEVISETRDEFGREIVSRQVVLKEGSRVVREACTLYPPTKVQFLQPDGTKANNIVSEAADGQLYMTYEFEGIMEKHTPIETQEENMKNWKVVARVAVNSTISTMRKMLEDGRIER